MTPGSKVNILHIPKWYPNAKDEQNGLFIQKQIRSVPNSFQVVIYINDGNTYKEESTILNDGNLIEIRVELPKVPIFIKAFRKRKIIDRIIHRYFKKHPDYIHLHIATPDQYFVKRYADQHKIPYLVSEHWSGYGDGRFDQLSGIKKRMIIDTLEGAKSIVVVSKFLKSQIQTKLKHGDFIIIPNIVEDSVGHSNKMESEGRSYMMLCDMVDDIKNISGVIKAFKNHQQKFVNDQLFLVGEGPDRKFLETLAQDLPIQFMGRISHEEALFLMGKMNTLIVNSRRETFSVVIGEALLRSTQVIATRCGGPNEWYPEDLVYFIDVDRDDQLISAMESVRLLPPPDVDMAKTLMHTFSYKEVGLALRKAYSIK